jgi:hypothetical protein
MTAFGIGVGHVRARGAAGSRATEDGLRVILDWIPVEVLGAYAALVTSLGATDASRGTSPGWLVLFCLLAAVTTVLGATSAMRARPAAQRTALGRGVLVRAAFSALALFDWSWMLPGTSTNRSGSARDSGAAVVVLVLLGAVVLGLAAQYLVEICEIPGEQRPIRRRAPKLPRLRKAGRRAAGLDLPVEEVLAEVDEDEEEIPVRVAAVLRLTTPAPQPAPAVLDEADEERAALPRLLCACYVAAAANVDGPLPDSSTTAFLIGSTSPGVADAQIVSAWGSGVRCLVANTLGGVVVAFGSALPEPGSDARAAVAEWIGAVDSDLIVHRWFAGRVHAGFVTELDRLWDRLDDQIRVRMIAAGPEGTIWLTGHGIGGGLAQLAAARVAARFFHRTLRVRTFGAARSGDGDFAAAYEKLVPDSVRLEFGNDLVPHLPLGSDFGTRLGNLEFIEQLGVYLHRDFHPVGALRYTALDGSVNGTDSDQLLLNRHRALAGIITSGNFGSLLTDHDGRPGGGYFRTVVLPAVPPPSDDPDGPADPDGPGASSRRWRRPKRTAHLRSVRAAGD